MSALKPNLTAGKQTVLGLYVTAKEAYEKWNAEPDKVKIIDVRTPEEFLFVGHPTMAWKIPVAVQSYEWNDEKKEFPMKPLHDFVSRTSKIAKPEDTLMVMCRSGGRSAIAVNMLATAGFKYVYNIVDGMEGDLVGDPASVFLGQRLVNGWKNSGCPWTYHLTPDRMLLPREQANQLRMKRPRHYSLVSLFCGCLFLLLAGCASPIGADRVTARQAYAQVEANALRDGKPSTATVAILHRHDLDRLAAHHPEEAVRQLHQKALATGERDLLFALSELSYVAAEQIGHGVKPWDARDARDFYLGSAVYAWLFLFGQGESARPGPWDPRVRKACDFYNYGLGLALRDRRSTNALVQLQEGVRHLPIGQIELKLNLTNFPDRLEDFGEFLLADQFRVRGLSTRNREPGIGAPLVAVRRFDPELAVRRCLPATAFLRLPTSLAEVIANAGCGSLELYSAFGNPTVAVGNTRVPLEIDVTTHMAYVMNQSFIWKLGMMQFLAPAKHMRSQLIPFNAFNTDRIPLVLVHGTFSSPVTWAEFINTLTADPVLRRRYQVWNFMYGSGNALPISATELRDALAATVQRLDPQGTNGLLRQMVVIGHSQGGLLTKLTATTTGDRLWRALSNKPLETFPITEAQRAKLRRWLFLEPLPFVSRVIFISTPHHGSYLASSFVRRLAARLVSLPSTTINAARDAALMTRGTAVEQLLCGRVPTSLDSMSPRNPAVLALADIPVAPRIKAHSIIPVKGAGDLQHGRDGVVDYPSAHVNYVESELVVRGAHSCQNLPATIQEVRRILHEHLKASSSSLTPTDRPFEGAQIGRDAASEPNRYSCREARQPMLCNQTTMRPKKEGD